MLAHLIRWPATRESASRSENSLLHPLGFIVLASTVLFGAILYPLVVSPQNGHLTDYRAHARFAEQMARTGVPPVPHFLYHLLTIGVQRAIPTLSFDVAGASVSLVCYVLLGIIVYSYLRHELANGCFSSSRFALVGVALGLLLVTPITVFTWPSHNLYLGYVGISTFHNPTIVLLKPLALLLFLYTLSIFSRRWSIATWLAIGIGVILTVLSTLAKPSFIICLLPAVVIVSAYQIARRKPARWWVLLGGLVLPALITLGWQYFYTYTSSTTGIDGSRSRVIIAPLLVYSGYSGMLLPKYVLSILFPLASYVAYFKKARQNLTLNLAWLAFLIGSFYAYFLAESGQRLIDGNFLWSAQVSLFVLFVVSTAFFMKHKHLMFDKPIRAWMRDKKFVLCVGAFSLHLVSGLAWYVVYLSTVNVLSTWW